MKHANELTEHTLIQLISDIHKLRTRVLCIGEQDSEENKGTACKNLLGFKVKEGNLVTNNNYLEHR